MVVALTLLGGALLFAGEWMASSTGRPTSVPGWLFFYLYFGAPLLVMATFVVAVAAAPVLLLLGWRRPARRWVHLGRCLALLLTPVVLGASMLGSTRLRLTRIAVAAERLTPAAQAYLAARAQGEAAEPPALNLRGCTPLEFGRAPEGGSTLVAECSRGLGAWDQLYFRPGADPPRRVNVERIGQWAYFWD